METTAWLDIAPHARFWRWRLEGDAIAVERTADVAAAVVASLNQTARTLFGSNHLPPDLHPEAATVVEAGVERHRHAFFLPEDLDLDGRLDHVAVAVAASLGGQGFTRKGLTLLAACPGFWLGRSDLRLQPLGLTAECPLGTGAASRAWYSITPFVPPLHRLSTADQIVSSLAGLGLPTPVLVEKIAEATATATGARTIPAQAFVPMGPAARRWKGDLAEPELARRQREMAYWRIDFAEPRPGPLSLGHLRHFGLGRFGAADA